MALNWPYENRGGYFYIDRVSILDAARRFGAPYTSAARISSGDRARLSPILFGLFQVDDTMFFRKGV